MHQPDDDDALLAEADAALATYHQQRQDYVDEIIGDQRRAWLRSSTLWGFRAWVYESGVEANGHVLDVDELLAALSRTAQLSHVPVMYAHNKPEHGAAPDPTEHGRLTAWSADARRVWTRSRRRVHVEGVCCYRPAPGQYVSLGPAWVNGALQWVTELSLLAEGVRPAVPGACVLDVWPFDVADIARLTSEGCD